jgi:hypothetical protein
MSILVKTDDPSQLAAFAKYLPLNPYDPSSLGEGELKEKIQSFCNRAKAHFEKMNDMIDEMLYRLIDANCYPDELITVADEFSDNFLNPAKRVYAHCIMVVNGYGHLSSLATIDWGKRRITNSWE